MDDTAIIEALSALAQPSRLAAFRLVVEHEPHGLPAGEIARRLDVPQNTMSSHLAQLTRAGLLSADKQGRTITYRAEIDRMRFVMSYLVNDCCGGRPELCAPLIEDITPCCVPEEARRD
ncbi:metalloregulator ArsR/SmtB family transcription factor [Devosia sp. XJ19-1]|uniref:Metalloregulator ArsR/SmtB family transcription factor n=1 Tax=Devosia ureilytica TaxID=2952754 RepID=A0A9Q4FTR8_9HYPH|nr:metalloregulator ArsR/SmtB family transcription factor [Devosia ureilytica]MCP8884558.1 metalloregulator ArsR/SmtB family transcription factor [Devosia ureilytica]MCP8888188.1 metalloregulator ArsR/SmtB family transcription factor [Devosia ureilytica]